MKTPRRVLFCKVCGKTGPAWQFAPLPKSEGEGHLCEEHSVAANQKRRGLPSPVVSLTPRLAKSRDKVRERTQNGTLIK